MYIPVSTHNGFIFILIFDIPNEPLGITISDTREPYTQAINGLAHTSYQSRRSYTVLLTQAVK
ncbi:Endoglucanase Z [Gossypium arboreum]|uniref:Endoglucanase Z n=1 Tax=Gossypium arboreum TaxID=29729 RepID=A0A0B0NWZ4_GOSAR|nr:Endoglucanase Z [Gossypium arboreum]